MSLSHLSWARRSARPKNVYPNLSQPLPGRQTAATTFALLNEPVSIRSTRKNSTLSQSRLLSSKKPLRRKSQTFPAKLAPRSGWSPSNTCRWCLGGSRGMAYWASESVPRSKPAQRENVSRSSTPRPVIALRRSFTPNSQLSESLTNDSAYPYYISEANRKALRSLAHVELSQYASKSILMASPHPGAALYLEATARAVAHDMGADFLTLDYNLMLQVAREVGGRDSKSENLPYSPRSDKPESLQLSPSFTPAHYTSIIQNDTFENEADDFDEEDMDDDHDADFASGQSGSAVPWAHIVRSTPNETKPVVVTLDIGERHIVEAGKSVPPTSTSSKDSSSTTSQTSNLPIKISFGPFPPPSTPATSNNSMSPPRNAALVSGTHYDERLSPQQVQDVSRSILDFIKSTCSSIPNSVLTNLRHTRRLVIYLKDVTDILEATGDTGRRIVLALLDIVQQARTKHNIPIVLIGGCSPTLLHPDHASEDANFYTELFGGEVLSNGKFSPEWGRLWTLGEMFKTPLDLMTADFEKVDMLPPIPSGEQAYKAQLAGRIADSPFHCWLETMDVDLRRRIREVNWQRVEALTSKRGITIRGLEVSAVMEGNGDRTIVPDSLQQGLHILEESIWPSHRIEKLVSLAMGFRLELSTGGSKSRAAGTDDVLREPLDLSARHFTEALHLMRESDPQNKIEKEDSDEEDSGASGGRGKRAPNPALSDSSLTSKETVAKPAESIADQLKRDGVQLSTHEKRLLSTVVNPDTIPVSFKDLVLPTNTKLILQTLVTLPLLKPHYFKSGILSRHAINGVLLFGPPGTGKTMLAKAVAKSSGARFMSVALSDIFDKYVGEGEKNVKALFTLARKLSPCVVFLDEVDALFGARRSDAAHASRREIINEFMSEWDGLTSNNSGIVIMGATNRPFDLDDAILRRLPRRVMVDLPTEEQRAKIIELHLRGEEVDSTVSLKSLAKQTPSYSGSDLKNVCVAAALTRVKQVLLSETSVGDDAEQGDSESQSRQLVEQLEQLKTKTLEADAANTNAAGNNKPRGRASVRARRSATPTSETPSLPTSPAPVPLPPLQSTHFEIALKEVPPSLTDEMQTLVELKKWDESYGEAAARRKGSAKKGWGFDMAKDGGDLDIKS